MVGGYAGSSLAWSGDSKTLNLVLSGTPSPLAWGTTGSGTWDVNNSANAVWKDNTATAAFYGEQTGSDNPGSRVLFDDAYIASDTAVTLSSFVSPATVAFSNSLYAYTISGVGAIAGNAGLVKAGTNLLTLATANTYTGGTVVAGGTLTLASGGAISHPTAGNILVADTLLTNALLKIASGASVSNKWLQAGSTNGASGAIYNQGSLVVAGGANFANFALGYGVGGYGYYRHDTAYPLTVAETGIASERNGSGVMDVLQGVVTNGSYFLVNRGTTTQYGQVNITGGRLLMPNSNANVALFWLANSAGLGVLNVSGGGLLGALGTATELDLIKTTTSTAALGVLNILSSGTVQATKVKSSRGEGVALVNFNGGTLKAGNNGNLLLGGSNIDRATVYANGATIDTDGKTVAVSQNLLAPLGNGVTSIPVTADGTGYIGRPVVTLTGGGGVGATAVAEFDPVSQKVTGVTVTSPGYSYTSAPTVTFVGGGGVAPTVGTVSYDAVASGGLTKSGNGVLTLSGANTYSGGTTVSNGTLKLGAANSLPTNSAVTVVGGVLDLNGYTVTNTPFTVLNGSVINGAVVAPTWQGADSGVIQARITSTNGLTKSGSGLLTISAALTYPGDTLINGGTVKLVGRQPGLYEGRVAGNFDLDDANPKTATPLSTRYADLWFNANGESGNIWADNTTYIYNGFLWNDSATNETWTFSKAFDDSVRILINGVNVLQNPIAGATIVSNATVNAGWNRFEVRLGQGTGGVGANGSGGFVGLGVGYDRVGRGQPTPANFKPLADPGDGSLLTLTNVFNLASANLLPTNSAVSVASGALLDLGGTGQALGGLSGAGTVSNGTLAVNGTIAPGGLNTLGTLALPAVSATLSGTLRIDVSDDGTCDVLAVGGNVSLSGLALSVDNVGQLNPSHDYTILTCAGTRTGVFSSKNMPSGWIAVYESNGDVKLKYFGGTLIRIR
jgi:autotransporter-associated beta strand protein